MKSKRQTAEILEKSMSMTFTVCGFIAVAFVLLITGFLVVSGTPAISEIGFFDFLFGTKWASTAKDAVYGILPFILSSFYGTFGAILIGVPLGILCAVFLAKVADGKSSAVVSNAVNLMSGIPSVVYGLVGMLIFVQFCSLGTSLLAGSLTLVIMTLPTIIRTTQESLKTVPNSYREGGLALGAGKWYMIRTAVLPSAVDGIITGCISDLSHLHLK